MARSGNGHIKMVDAGCEMAFRTLEVLAYVKSKKRGGEQAALSSEEVQVLGSKV